jgi:hypothetical protein
MPATTKHKPEEIVAAVKKYKGRASAVADELGVTTQTIYNYRDRWTSVRDALADQKNRRDDHVESVLDRLIDEGNVTAVIFYAKTQMKHRGYVERQEVTGAAGGPVVIEMTWGDNADGNG